MYTVIEDNDEWSITPVPTRSQEFDDLYVEILFAFDDDMASGLLKQMVKIAKAIPEFKVWDTHFEGSRSVLDYTVVQSVQTEERQYLFLWGKNAGGDQLVTSECVCWDDVNLELDRLLA